MFKRFLDELELRFPAYVARVTLMDSVCHLAGQRLTKKALNIAIWRLYGNLSSLKQGRAVRPWTSQTVVEWVPAEIVKVELARGGRYGRQLGHKLFFQVLAGTSCGLIASDWWSTRRQHYIAKFRNPNGHGFGFAPRQRSNTLPFLFVDTRQFVRLRCFIQVRPELCTDEPGFDQVAFTAAMYQWNRNIITMRARMLGHFRCPLNFPLEDPCHACVIGRSQCPIATHARTYVLRPCRHCKNEKAISDPDDRLNQDLCVNCVNQLIAGPHEHEGKTE